MRKLPVVALAICLAFASRFTACGQNNSLDEAFNQGEYAYFDGRNARALECFNICVTRGADPRYYYFRGLTLLRRGQTDAAERDFFRGAELERERIELGNLSLDEAARLSSVNQSLERVQGSARLSLERHRLKIYDYVREAQAFKQAQIADIRRQILAETRRRQAERPKSLQAIVGEVVKLHGNPLRVLCVEEYQGGIRSLTVVDASLSMNPASFARTSINTGNDIVKGQAAFEYIVQRESRIYFAAEIVRLEHKNLPTELEFNPLYNILSDPVSAAAGWQRCREIEAERQRAAAIAAKNRRAELERLRLSEQRWQEQQRLAERLARDRSFHNPPSSAGYNSESSDRAIIKILGAWGFNSLAHNADQRTGRLAAVFSLGGRLARNLTIESAINDLFPDMDRGEIKAMQVVISLILDDRLNVENLTEAAAKETIMEALRSEDPSFALTAEVGDFLYQLHKEFDKHR